MKFNFASIWAGSLTSFKELDEALDRLYDTISPSTQEFEPVVVAEDELLEFRSMLVDVRLPQNVKDRISKIAAENGLDRASVVVLLYSREELTCSKPCEGMTFLGAFQIVEAKEIQGGTVEPAERPHEEGEPNLYKACRKGDLKRIHELLRDGGDVNEGNEIGHTPLMVACTTENPVVVKQLLDSGASVLQRTPGDAYAPIHWAVMHPPSVPTNVVKILDLLIANGADVNAVGASGTSALMHAVWFGSTPVVEFLLKNGANSKLVDVKGRTAITVAETKGYAEIAQILRDANLIH